MRIIITIMKWVTMSKRKKKLRRLSKWKIKFSWSGGGTCRVCLLIMSANQPRAQWWKMSFNLGGNIRDNIFDQIWDGHQQHKGGWAACWIRRFFYQSPGATSFSLVVLLINFVHLVPHVHARGTSWLGYPTFLTGAHTVGTSQFNL